RGGRLGAHHRLGLRPTGERREGRAARRGQDGRALASGGSAAPHRRRRRDRGVAGVIRADVGTRGAMTARLWAIVALALTAVGGLPAPALASTVAQNVDPIGAVLDQAAALPEDEEQAETEGVAPAA